MLDNGTQVSVHDPLSHELLALCRTFTVFKNYFMPKSLHKGFDSVKNKIIESRKYNRQFLIKEHKEIWQSQQAMIFKKVIEKR